MTTETLATPPRSARRLIVGDLHGDWANMLGLLRAVGAIDGAGRRREGWWILQLGDLIHGGHREPGDARCLAEGLRLFDVVLYGNHELPHAFPDAGFPEFAGRTPLSAECQALLDRAVGAGRFAAAAAVDGWLVTHAGLHPVLARDAALPVEPVACAAELNARFAARVSAGVPTSLFDAVGRERGGRDPVGGIFWLDWDVLRAAAGSERRQIVGHTPRPAPELAGTHLWCVDVGAALSGKVCAITRQGQRGRWRPVTHPSAGQVRRSAPRDGPGGRPERPAGL